MINFTLLSDTVKSKKSPPTYLRKLKVVELKEEKISGINNNSNSFFIVFI